MVYLYVFNTSTAHTDGTITTQSHYSKSLPRFRLIEVFKPHLPGHLQEAFSSFFPKSKEYQAHLQLNL